MVVHRTKSEWTKIVDAYKESGQTQTEFCNARGLNVKTLGNHIREAKNRKRETARSTEEWIELIKQQQASGLSRSAWCKKHKINSDSMSTAERRIVKNTSNKAEAKWMEFSIATEGAKPALQYIDSDWGVRMRTSGLEIEVNAGYPVEKLAELIRKLVNMC